MSQLIDYMKPITSYSELEDAVDFVEMLDIDSLDERQKGMYDVLLILIEEYDSRYR